MQHDFIDTHVHLWNVEENPWYPELMDSTHTHAEADIAAIEKLRCNYLLDDYLRDASGNGLTKFIHVSAAQHGGNELAELVWLQEMAERTGMPHALIGQLEPRDPIDTIAHSLAVQTACPLMRGVRITFNLDPISTKAAEIFELVAQAGCLLEIVAQPHLALDFAELLDRFPEMTVVIEHCGWPTQRDDPGHFAIWRQGMARLAERPSTLCKLSGLPMALRTHDVDKLRPWIDACIDLFGDDRCMFGSNFPVDRLFGSFEEIFSAYRAIVKERSTAAQARLFAGNAARVYRL